MDNPPDHLSEFCGKFFLPDPKALQFVPGFPRQKRLSDFPDEEFDHIGPMDRRKPCDTKPAELPAQ